ncbi:MAG: hypothetical protein DRN27_08205 [Thermoplasmata archaeon]|nr:MAG: hypothetical protein DRN27_08205 [Thermoplasmata archaeon]
MSKYNSITDGMKIVDTVEDDGGYNYYGYIRANGEWVIMRENTAQTEYRYKIGARGYDFSNRASGTYRLPIIG